MAEDSSTARPDAIADTECRSLEPDLAATLEELQTLYAALDNIQSGVLLLDKDLRARFTNPALHKLFKNASPKYVRMMRPSYEQLLKDAQTVSAVELDDYVRRRLEWVKSGDPKPMDLKMSGGNVVRCHLATLPEGGRMLIYSDITDIVRTTEKLERLATIDGMTGIYNRRHFLKLANHEWRRARRHGHPLSMLMVDIDHFKRINDSYGHPTGDAVIVHLAKLASSCKRGSDLLARIGGEEFALLLPETSLLEAKTIAERLRAEVSKARVDSVTADIRTTVSIGVAASVDGSRDISALMLAADEALYQAKRGGRNQVVSTMFTQNDLRAAG